MLHCASTVLKIYSYKKRKINVVLFCYLVHIVKDYPDIQEDKLIFILWCYLASMGLKHPSSNPQVSFILQIYCMQIWSFLMCVSKEGFNYNIVWDHNVLLKCTDWILQSARYQVLLVRFGLRSVWRAVNLELPGVGLSVLLCCLSVKISVCKWNNVNQLYCGVYLFNNKYYLWFNSMSNCHCQNTCHFNTLRE